MRRRSNEKLLPPVRPSAGIEAEYRRRLRKLIKHMHDEFVQTVSATFERHEPVMTQLAQDATPAVQLQDAVNKMTKRWEDRFDRAAVLLAKYFATEMSKRSDTALRSALKRGGFTVKFTMTPAMRDIMQATINEQVGLIKSIPQQYLVNVQGDVMRSVTAGRDLASLTAALQKQYGVTYRRAAFIARDQNNKANASMTRARQIELGIEEAIWVHSHGGKQPRPTHLKNDGNRYDPRVGWFDPDPKVRRHIFPGELINCRCFSRPVVKGFT